MSAHDSVSDGEKAGEPVHAGAGTTASALWVPLVALGLLGAAIWFGSTPSSGPVVEPVAVPRPIPPAAAVDPLPSWNDGPAKKAILDFVAAVTREGTATFVPPEERVAVFDHDGTLICEKPLAHGLFLVDRIRALAARRPEIADEEPYATLLTGDFDLVRRLGRKQLVELTFSTIAGESLDRLEADAREFIRSARHPAFGVPLGETSYQPMRELIRLLEDRKFAVWICSGSGLNFLRPAAVEWHGVAPDRVIASRPATALREADAAADGSAAGGDKRPELVVLPELRVFNDRAQKPVSIAEQIGRRPILAAGNVGTGGDIEMLRWSQAGGRPSLQLLVLHDDAEREMAYDEPRRESLDAAARHGWQVVRMKTDWNRVFPLPLAKVEAPAAVPEAARPAAAAVPGAVAADRPPDTASAAGPPAAETAPPTPWVEALAAIADRDRQEPPRSGGICLLGSSNVSTWQTLTEDFPGLDVVNRGVSGCRLGELAAHLRPLLEPVRPRVVVVAAGTNDVADGRTAEEVRAAFAGLVAAIDSHSPGAKVVFLGISPTLKRWEQWPRQQEANAAVRAWIEQAPAGQAAEGTILYLDTAAAFLGADGRPAAECFLADGQHPSTIGNSRRAALMRPVLTRLAADRVAE